MHVGGEGRRECAQGRLGAESAPYDPAVMDVSLIVPRGFVKSILSDVICRT